MIGTSSIQVINFKTLCQEANNWACKGVEILHSLILPFGMCFENHSLKSSSVGKTELELCCKWSALHLQSWKNQTTSSILLWRINPKLLQALPKNSSKRFIRNIYLLLRLWTGWIMDLKWQWFWTFSSVPVLSCTDSTLWLQQTQHRNHIVQWSIALVYAKSSDHDEKARNIL
jgi:hypothetical protein